MNLRFAIRIAAAAANPAGVTSQPDGWNAIASPEKLRENNTADPRMKNAMKPATKFLFSPYLLCLGRDLGGGKVGHAMPRRLCQPLHTSSPPIAVRNIVKTVTSRM